jgi:MinD-like ATPase involved in chromosome partitioning or flagellar assembly
MTSRSRAMTSRSRGAVIDGLPAHQGAFARVRRRAQRLAVSRGEQDEAEVERRLLGHPGVTRANTVAFMSPAGGVGKTACAFVIGSLFATHLKLRAIAVDATPGFGTLAQLVPEARRAELGIGELLRDSERLFTAAELTPYVSRLPTGLHVLAARHHERVGAEELGELLALLSCFYEVILLDLGAGVIGPPAQLAAARADQIVLVTTPERMASSAMLHARAYLQRPERTVVAINGTHRDARADGRPYKAVAIPHDEQLAAMLESRTYSIGALAPTTRAAIKRLGASVAEQLV